MPYVNAPPGLRQLKMYDGTVIPVDRATGRMDVSNPDHARAIDSMTGNGTAGLLTAGFRVFGSSPRAGRWCKSCKPARLWNAWNLECPRCGAATEQEQS
jgi:hypothetical protein